MPEGAVGNKKDGITYDGTAKEISIVVNDDGKGGLVVANTADTLKVTASNTYSTTDTSAKVSATKVFTGRDWTDSDSFEFTLAADASNPAGATLPTTVKKNATKTAQTVEFDAITFTKAGTYKFTITETVPEGAVGNKKDGITYDTTPHNVVVTVVDNHDGTLTATAKYDEADSLTITNTYAAKGEITFSGTKNLQNRILTEGEFSFELYEGENTTPLQTVTNAADGSYRFTKIEYTEADLNKDTAGSYVETTKTYKVVEKAGRDRYIVYDNTVYDITVTLKDNGDGTISVNADPKENSYDFTNTYAATDITIRKVWNDNNNQDGVRPASVTVVLTANGVGVPGAVNVTLNATNNWTATFKDLPVYKNGAPINYVWIESVPTGYTANITRTENQGEWIYTLTNSRTPETTSRTIRKVWNDQNNVDGIRPAELTVVLTGSNQYTNTLQLNAGNNWTQTVENLPVFDNGTRITYTWTEWATAGYVLTDSTTDGTTTTFTNTHEVDSRTLTVVKVWDDADNADGLRPATLNVNLQANGVTVRTVALSEANGWRQTVTDLPMRDANGLINYSWVEPNVPGYTLSGTEENAGVTTITNRHEIDRTARTVSKRWNHGRNLQALWPTAVHVQLYAGNVLTGEVTLTAANGWTATLDDLPMREAGEEIVYRWVEHSVPMYILTDTAITGDTTVFTNTYRDREVPPGDVPVPGPPLFEIDDFDTPLGVEVILNHVGDCYD